MGYYPVVLSGGYGSRLWPLSRRSYPKQLLPLIGGRSLLQQALERLAPDEHFGPPTLVVSAEQRFAVAEQVRLAGIKARAILLEEAGRNTAPAIALAAMHIARDDPQAVLVTLPSDHYVVDPAAFRQAALLAAEAASDGWIVTVGIEPTHPETGFGWIEPGAPLTDGGAVCRVTAFREKPDRKTAGELMAANCLWNAGVVVLRADTFLEELQTLEPAIYAAVRTALESGVNDMDFVRVNQKALDRAPSMSIDHAILEKGARVAVVRGAFGWSDLGGYDALYEIEPQDPDGNAPEPRWWRFCFRCCRA